MTPFYNHTNYKLSTAMSKELNPWALSFPTNMQAYDANDAYYAYDANNAYYAHLNPCEQLNPTPVMQYDKFILNLLLRLPEDLY